MQSEPVPVIQVIIIPCCCYYRPLLNSVNESTHLGRKLNKGGHAHQPLLWGLEVKHPAQRGHWVQHRQHVKMAVKPGHGKGCVVVAVNEEARIRD